MAFNPTPEQARILAHPPERHGCVLAGPGTGKSTTLVALLEIFLSGSEPHPRVKFLTFTRAATAELAEKVAGQSSSSAALRPSTVHSFAISVLMQNPGTGGFPEPLRMADSWEQRNVIAETLKCRTGYSIAQIQKLVREMAANWESLVPEEDPEIDHRVRVRFRGIWEDHRDTYGYTDVSELPYALRRALEQHDTLAGLDYDVIFVDEYQDLNACDLDVLRRIAERGCTIIAAGDDDQSIYSFRKAHPAGIRRFGEEYAQSQSYDLTETLRCGRRIIEWANHVILGDSTRPPERAVVRAREGAPDGEVALLSFRGHVAEARGVARIVKGLIDHEGIDPSEILVLLTRDHKRMFSRPIREEMEALGIECSDPTVLDELLAASQNRELIALARLLDDRQDSLAWATLITLRRGLNAPDFLDYVYEPARVNGRRFSDELFRLHHAGFPDAPGRSGLISTSLINETLQWLEGLETPPLTPEQGWGHWIAELAAGNDRLAPMDEFVESLQELDEHIEEQLPIGRFLGLIRPLGYDLAQSHSSGVRIMTMTRSKGLTV